MCFRQRKESGYPPRSAGMDDKSTAPAAWIGQGLLYSLFAIAIGTFSTWPAYRHLPADQALIKLSFIHHGKLVSECRKLSEAELARLPPN